MFTTKIKMTHFVQGEIAIEKYFRNQREGGHCGAQSESVRAAADCEPCSVSSDERLRMNAFEKKLADTVREYPHLYNHSLRDYKDPQKALKSWQEVADSLDTTEDNARQKWKNLRDKFSKAKKRMARRRGVPDEERPVPALYSQLAWLCPYVKLRELDEVLDEYDVLEIDEELDGESVPSSVVSTSGFLQSKACPGTPQQPGGVAKRKRLVPGQTDNAAYEQKIPEAQQKPRDEDELFLLSLLPSIKRLTIKQRTEVRMKFQQVLYEAEFQST